MVRRWEEKRKQGLPVLGRAVIGTVFNGSVVVKTPLYSSLSCAYTVRCLTCGYERKVNPFSRRKGSKERRWFFGKCAKCFRREFQAVHEARVGKVFKGWLKVLAYNPKTREYLCQCVRCLQRFPFSIQSMWALRRNKYARKLQACKSCISAIPDQHGRKITVAGETHNMAIWGEKLGISRERVRQLQNQGRLRVRVLALFSKEKN